MDKEIELLKLKIEMLEKEIELEKIKRTNNQIPTAPYVGSPYPHAPYPYKTFTQPHSFTICTALGTTATAQ